MRDYNGVQINAGDYVEVRADGNDADSTFYSGIVELSVNTLCLPVKQFGGKINPLISLAILSHSNDVVVVNKGDGLID